MSVYCIECGEEIQPDDSPGVWVHCDTEEQEGLDIDREHTALPEANTETGYPE